MSLLSGIYGAGIAARNALYDRGVFRTRRLSRPVVSIGNISVGGSGKTPFVIFLGEQLKQRGVPFSVLSRGYRRRTRGVLVVNPSGSAEEFGDEPLLIARRLECPVIVGESRYQAGLVAEREFSPQLHILDDGFQHRSLARSFDIVLLTQEDVRDDLLPTGRLREPLPALRRADAIALVGEIDLPLPSSFAKPVWHVRRGVSISNTPEKPVLFCGIARPELLVQQLEAEGIQPIAQKIFRDHHAYSDADIQALLRLKQESGATGFITTEKDSVNLGSRVGQLGAVSIARVTMEIEQPADAVDMVLRTIADRKRQA